VHLQSHILYISSAVELSAIIDNSSFCGKKKISIPVSGLLVDLFLELGLPSRINLGNVRL